MRNYQELITKYVGSLEPAIFSVGGIENVEATPLPQGNWNFNYLVTINSRKFVFKLYSPNIQGLLFENSGKNEFMILNLIKDLEISPKPVHFDESGTFFNYSVLIYEYAEGQRLTFSNETVQEIAKIFAKIHTLDPAKASFVEEKDHSSEHLTEEIIKSLNNYRQRDDAQAGEIELFGTLIEKAKEHISKANLSSNLSYPKTLLHTDPVPSNFIVGDKVNLIDWQRPIIADPAFDVWAFLSEPFNLWDWSETIPEKQKNLFLKTYLNSKRRRPPPVRDRWDARPFGARVGAFGARGNCSAISCVPEMLLAFLRMPEFSPGTGGDVKFITSETMFSSPPVLDRVENSVHFIIIITANESKGPRTIAYFRLFTIINPSSRILLKVFETITLIWNH